MLLEKLTICHAKSDATHDDLYEVVKSQDLSASRLVQDAVRRFAKCGTSDP